MNNSKNTSMTQMILSVHYVSFTDIKKYTKYNGAKPLFINLLMIILHRITESYFLLLPEKFLNKSSNRCQTNRIRLLKHLKVNLRTYQ